MSFLSRVTARKRLRQAQRRLGLNPSQANYVSLAREHIIGGNTQEVLRVCTEGLEVHTKDPELQRLAARARHLQLNDRIKVLQQDLTISSRPALWRELCELLLECGQLTRAEEATQRWHSSLDDAEALCYRARVRAAMFFSGGRRDDGRLAFDLAEKAAQELTNDARPLKIQYEIARRCGAWQEARKAIARLLELMPGNPALESRFRTVLAHCESAKPLDRALNEVERTGCFIDDEAAGSDSANLAVRPILQKLGAETSVRAALYLRGGTALVQGPHGATADRTARAVREVVQASRTTARRVGLGRPVEAQIEGDFGSLLLIPGELGAAAVWCAGPLKHHHRELCKRLSGMAGAAMGGIG